MESESPTQHYKYLWGLPLPLLLTEKTNAEAELKDCLKQEKLAGMYGGFPTEIRKAKAKKAQLKEALKYIKAEITHREKI